MKRWWWLWWRWKEKPLLSVRRRIDLLLEEVRIASQGLLTVITGGRWNIDDLWLLPVLSSRKSSHVTCPWYSTPTFRAGLTLSGPLGNALSGALSFLKYVLIPHWIIHNYDFTVLRRLAFTIFNKKYDKWNKYIFFIFMKFFTVDHPGADPTAARGGRALSQDERHKHQFYMQ